MAVKQVLRMGHPLLLQVSKPVEEFNTPALHSLIQDMFDTMDAHEGVGLAAPQIGVSQRIVVFGITHNRRYPDAGSIPMTVLINPSIQIIGDDCCFGWEGCLSVPGMRGEVARANRLIYSGFDAQGSRFERDVGDFHARVVQHEVDHLDGLLYPSRIENMSRFGFAEEIESLER